MSRIRRSIAVSIVMACPTLSQAADPQQQNPHQIIEALRQRLYAVGETTGKITDFVDAEAQASERMRQFVANNSGSAGLTEKDKSGMTPLIKASYLGYADIVSALLKDPTVIATIDGKDGNNVSAWIYANFGLRQSVVACNPTIMQNPFSFIPVAVTQPFYFSRNPYPQVRDVLAKAGAAADMEGAKAAWSRICQKQSPQTRAKVEASADMQAVVIEEGRNALMAALAPKPRPSSP